VTEALNRPLGLHCLLYLSADRICVPQPSRPGGRVTEALSTRERPLARVAGGAIDASVRMLRWMDLLERRVSVPCLAEVNVGEWDLGRRLLMAAVLECRDIGRVELRLVEPPTVHSRRNLFMGDSYVQVRLLDGPPLDGLCGRILERLEGKGDQEAYRLLNRVTGRNRMGGGAPYAQRLVMAKVTDELAARGYTKGTSEGPVVFDCQRVQTLAEACARAVDRWNRAWAADPLLCDALLAACTESIAAKGGG
jgi:hypothetical protein